jgi:hypothetical protein
MRAGAASRDLAQGCLIAPRPFGPPPPHAGEADRKLGAVPMDPAFFKIAEIGLFFAAVVGVLVYQLWVTQREIRKDRSKKTRHPEG